MTPEEIILRKTLVLNGDMSSADWETVSAAVKDRAFFSSRVASVNFLDVCQSKIAEILQHAKNSDGALVSRAEAVSAIMQAARAEGIYLGSERVSDPGSEARANVIIDTNAGLAAGYVQAEIANTYGARLAFPAQELVRIEKREQPRNWLVRWVKNGGRVYSGRMIALKGDPIWLKLSRFGVPYPPFDFNSGMGVEDVSRDDAISLGVIKDDYKPPKASPLKEFNDGLEASMKVDGPRSARVKELQNIFGDQIQYNPHTKKVYFDGAMIHDIVARLKAASQNPTDRIAFGSIKAKPSLGRPSEKFCKAASFQPKADSSLRLPASNIAHILKDHVGVDKDPNNNIALAERELGLIGHIWRNPDDVVPAEDGHWMLVKRAAGGGLYRLVVSADPNGGLVFHTFYKTKK